MKKLIQNIALTLCIYCFFLWLYIVANSEFHMETLSMPLTHLLPYPREDTTGIVAFLVSGIAFFIWRQFKDKT